MSSDVAKRDYLLQQLPTHLDACGDHNGLEELLVDLTFIHQKTYNYFSNSLIADTQLSGVRDRPKIILLRDILSRFAHIFGRCEEELELLNSILIRLISYEDFKADVEKFAESHDQMLLFPARPLPDQENEYELRTITHNAGILSLAFNRDGSQLFSANREFRVRAWDVTTGQEKYNLIGHEADLTCLKYIYATNQILSGAEDGQVILWDLAEQKPACFFQGTKKSILDLAVMTDGEKVIAVSEDGVVYIWSRVTFELLGTISDLPALPMCVCFTTAQNICVLGLEDGQIICVDLENFNILRQTRAHEDRVSVVTYDPYRDQIISSGKDSQIKIHALKDFSHIATLLRHNGEVLDLAVSPDGSMLASAGFDELLLLWDLEKQKLFAGLAGHNAPYDGGLPAVAFHPDGNQITSGSVHETIRLWRVPSEPVLEFSKPVYGYYCDFHPKLNLLQTANGDIIFWNPETWEVVKNIPRDMYSYSSSALSPDGNLVWLGTNNGHLRSLTFPELAPRLAWQAHSKGINHVELSKNLIATSSDDDLVKVWRQESGELIHELSGHASNVFACAISPDESTLVSVGLEEEMRVWSLETGEQLHKLEDHPADIVRCRYSQSGRWLLTASHDGASNLWDTQTWEVIRTFMGHLAWVNDAVFNPDENLVATASQDETLRIWDLLTGETKAMLRLDGWLEGLTWHADERTISAIGQNGLYSFRIVYPQKNV